MYVVVNSCRDVTGISDGISRLIMQTSIRILPVPTRPNRRQRTAFRVYMGSGSNLGLRVYIGYFCNLAKP